MSVARPFAATPMVSEILAPKIRRDRTSRPFGSVPSGNRPPGGNGAPILLSPLPNPVYGLCGASSGPNTATIRSASTTTAPANAGGSCKRLRYSSDHRDSMTGGSPRVPETGATAERSESSGPDDSITAPQSREHREPGDTRRGGRPPCDEARERPRDRYPARSGILDGTGSPAVAGARSGPLPSAASPAGADCAARARGQPPATPACKGAAAGRKCPRGRRSRPPDRGT